MLLQVIGLAEARQVERATILATTLLVFVNVVVITVAPLVLHRFCRASRKTMHITIVVLELVLDLGFLFIAVVGRGSEIQAEEHLVHCGTIFATYSAYTTLQDVVDIVEERDVTSDLDKPTTVGPTPSGLFCASLQGCLTTHHICTIA